MNKHRDIEAIFQIARKIKDPEKREPYLDQACDGNHELRNQVEALLKSLESDTEFLKSNERVASTAAAAIPQNIDNKQIGPYKIREQIGEGGMGVVYVAEQQTPVRRKVALKIIKPGMDSKEVVARFEAERQALAMMDHPNIAKVLDAGTTESGHPYFAMELVKGIEITSYCDQRKMSIRERLELYTQICQAIQHAHQKGVIHRDIKPSNLLVTEQDGKAVPKVIDFGVAKAIGQSLTDRTIYTSFQAVIGTPLYMSPEQAALSNVDVDTRSDVYSLGVLLYELLTGATPFDKETFKYSAQDEVLRMIREQDPPKPSTRISTLGDRGSTVSAGRSTNMSGLGKIVRGDLDWIVMKALEKDRNRRYETASGLGADVERFLNNEPIVARPPSTAYRVRKFYSRNRTLTATSLVVLLALATGLLLALWGMTTANRSLDLLREQIVLQGIERTLNGDSGAEDSILVAEQSGVEGHWISTLKGSLALHQGELDLAKQHFSNALALNPENVSAWSLQSIALYHSGEIDKWNLHMQQRIDMMSRASSELDRLFLAYAEFYVDFEKSASLLDEVIKAHPSWIVPHMLQAAASAEHAWSHSDEESIRAAIKRVRGISEVGQGIPFVDMGSLFVFSVAKSMGVDEEAGFNVKQRGDELAKSLGEMPRYSTATLIRTNWHDVTGDLDKVTEAWHQLLLYSDGNMAARAIAEVYARNLDANEVSQLKKMNAEARIAQACVLAMQQNQESRDKAGQVLSEFKNSRLLYIRYRLLPLLMLMNDGQEAKELCNKWLEDNDSIGSREYEDIYFEESLKFVADRVDRLSTDSDSPYRQQVAQFIAGLDAYARGEKKEAIAWMERCKRSVVMGTERSWARALHAHWTQKKFTLQGAEQ